MANTAASILNVAQSYVDRVSGRPNGFTRDYASRHGSEFLRAAWCDMFVTYCARKSGAKAALPNGDRAYTVWHANDFEGINRWYSGTTVNIRNHAAPGDIVFFDWGGTNTRGTIDHVGIVKKNLGDGRLVTVEGNTGDAVRLRVRGADVIAGFGQPRYTVVKPKPIGKAWPYKRTTLMRKGWENSAGVKVVQDALNKLGYKPVLVEDGDFGALTERAVRWFQKKAKIEVDGIVGPITWVKLWLFLDK